MAFKVLKCHLWRIKRRLFVQFPHLGSTYWLNGPLLFLALGLFQTYSTSKSFQRIAKSLYCFSLLSFLKRFNRSFMSPQPSNTPSFAQSLLCFSVIVALIAGGLFGLGISLHALIFLCLLATIFIPIPDPQTSMPI